MEPIIFESKTNSDYRGTVSFTNDLNLNKVVRTYKVINKQEKVPVLLLKITEMNHL